MQKKQKSKVVRYNKWGYIFLTPFILVYIVFNLIPLFTTIFYSFYEYFRSGLDIIGPNFIGFENYIAMFKNSDIWMYAGNTLIMWVLGFVPQILVSLLLGAWFSNPSLRLKGQRFFKTVIYLPNLIMASAFAMLFFTLFSEGGPVNDILVSLGIFDEPYKFLDNMWSTRPCFFAPEREVGRQKPCDMFADANTIYAKSRANRTTLPSFASQNPPDGLTWSQRVVYHSASLRYSGRSHASRAYHTFFCSLFDPRFRLASSRTAGARLRAPSSGNLYCR